MTCKKCGRKVRGRPAASGICPACRAKEAEKEQEQSSDEEQGDVAA